MTGKGTWVPVIWQCQLESDTVVVLVVALWWLIVCGVSMGAQSVCSSS